MLDAVVEEYNIPSLEEFLEEFYEAQPEEGSYEREMFMMGGES